MEKSWWYPTGIRAETCVHHLEKQFWKGGGRIEGEYADGKDSAWTAETKTDHQKVQKILWQKTLHDKMEDEIQQWNMQISEQKK